jgi:TPR repeat protein
LVAVSNLAAWRIWALALLVLAAAAPSEVAAGLAEFRQGLFAEAFRDWDAASQAGDARGALYIGVLYDTGLGGAQDFAKAMAWYKQAALGGSAVGAFNAGVLYDAGLGVPKNPQEAAHWYALAAQRGFARAQYNLALLYESGTGVAKNRQKAISLFKSAAARGVTASRAHLSALGVAAPAPTAGVQANPMADFQQAQHMIASRSTDEVAKAAAVFRQSAEKHDALAEYDLGYCYERGLGVPPDSTQALLWYGRAVADSKDAAIKSAAQSSIDYLHRVQARAAPQ